MSIRRVHGLEAEDPAQTKGEGEERRALPHPRAGKKGGCAVPKSRPRGSLHQAGERPGAGNPGAIRARARHREPSGAMGGSLLPDGSGGWQGSGDGR